MISRRLFFLVTFFFLKLFTIEKPILSTKITNKRKKNLPPNLPVPQVNENQPLLPTPLS